MWKFILLLKKLFTSNINLWFSSYIELKIQETNIRNVLEIIKPIDKMYAYIHGVLELFHLKKRVDNIEKDEKKCNRI